EALKKNNGNVVAEDFINAGTQDYSAVLTKLKAENPDVLFFSGYYTDGGLIRAQMKQLGMETDFVGGDANQNAAFAKIAGNAAQGAVIVNVPAPENLPYPEAKEFLTSYEKAFGAPPPSIYTLTNADGLRAVFAAIEDTKSTDTSKLIPWLHSMKQPFPGLTGPFTWDDKGERIGSPMSAFEVQADGSYKTFRPTDQACVPTAPGLHARARSCPPYRAPGGAAARTRHSLETDRWTLSSSNSSAG